MPSSHGRLGRAIFGPTDVQDSLSEINLTAGASGFLLLTQSGERPDLYFTTRLLSYLGSVPSPLPNAKHASNCSAV